MELKSTLLILVAVLVFQCVQSRSLQKRAAFYIANETACVVDNIVYYNGDPIPTDDPCEACKCRPPGFACVLRECEVKPGCRAVRRAGHCCPKYVCGCEHNGRMYRDGDEIRDSQNPCYTCHCQGSAIACAFVDCFFRVDCAPDYVQGECCPRYEHCASLGTSSNDSIPQVISVGLPPIPPTTRPQPPPEVVPATTTTDALQTDNIPIVEDEINREVQPDSLIEGTTKEPIQDVTTKVASSEILTESSSGRDSIAEEIPNTDASSLFYIPKETEDANLTSSTDGKLVEVTTEGSTSKPGAGDSQDEAKTEKVTTTVSDQSVSIENAEISTEPPKEAAFFKPSEILSDQDKNQISTTKEANSEVETNKETTTVTETVMIISTISTEKEIIIDKVQNPSVTTESDSPVSSTLAPLPELLNSDNVQDEKSINPELVENGTSVTEKQTTGATDLSTVASKVTEDVTIRESTTVINNDGAKKESSVPLPKSPNEISISEENTEVKVQTDVATEISISSVGTTVINEVPTTKNEDISAAERQDPSSEVPTISGESPKADAKISTIAQESSSMSATVKVTTPISAEDPQTA